MFTGIVQGTAEVIHIDEKEKFRTHVLALPEELLTGLNLGASVAHNGCCLTVTKIEGNQVSFDLMQETLKVTNLGEINTGDRVNVERAARFGDDIGGHSMSGHIITTAEISQIIKTANNCQIWIKIPLALKKYIFTKGYIGIDGISLTVGDIIEDRFSINLIPETLTRTNLAWRTESDRLNIEVDPQTQAIVDTVERVLAERNQ
ncbi:riboflavin synthase subunit alpha [Motiliproteus sp. MSK22-1]|uniref:riboflavin synthase subunit alpha n=1 Tax=Motiliproteus sp. MSK22-1 TaxID=1897630 RepID=UPI0009776D60|nr:riboflavin synthase subunit alpha [Motiliproteus sp. MSK22-1]OMH32837.1 riboflavin synthase subunit alpha [Motiliproteus sp. MSK22-1]